MAALTSADPKTITSQSVHTDCQYTVVDLADDATTVYTGPCVLYGLVVTTILSAHPLEVKDGSVVIAALKDTAVVGVTTSYAGIRCDTSLVVDPDNSASGRVTVIWRKVNTDRAGQ